MFSGPSLVSVATSLERERAAQPVRVATRASSIPIMSLRPNPHKSWAGSDLVTCSPSIGWELVSPFVADSRQYVAKYQQDRDRTWIAYPGACGKSGCTRTTGQSFRDVCHCPNVPVGIRPWLSLTQSGRIAWGHRAARVCRLALWMRDACGAVSS
jgi:hypothetical protein